MGGVAGPCCVHAYVLCYRNTLSAVQRPLKATVRLCHVGLRQQLTVGSPLVGLGKTGLRGAVCIWQFAGREIRQAHVVQPQAALLCLSVLRLSEGPSRFGGHQKK